VRTCPCMKPASQVEPQSIPAGELVTVPAPVVATFSCRCGGLKVAATDWALLRVTSQTPVPEQAPDQPAKVEPPSGLAVSVTFVPSGKPFSQVEPQSIPAGELVTRPAPVPPLDTLSEIEERRSKVALTSFAASPVTSHLLPLAVPGHDSQTTGLEPAPGVAVSVTTVPWSKLALQVPPSQSIPAGELTTSPAPLPSSVTVSWCL